MRALTISEKNRDLIDGLMDDDASLTWMQFPLHTKIDERNAKITNMAGAGASTHEWDNNGWFSGGIDGSATLGDKSYKDDGSMDALLKMDDSSFVGTVIIACWIYVGENTFGTEYFWSIGSTDTNGWFLRFSLLGGVSRISANMKVSNTTQLFSLVAEEANSDYSLNTPTPVVLVLNMDSGKVTADLYVDSAAVVSQTTPQTLPLTSYGNPNTNHEFAVGATNHGGTPTTGLGSAGALADAGATAIDSRIGDLLIVRSDGDISGKIADFVSQFGNAKTDLPWALT